MVRLKTAYWEFDFEAVCPTLDHDLLSQAHIYISKWQNWMSKQQRYNHSFNSNTLAAAIKHFSESVYTIFHDQTTKDKGK